MTFKFQNKSLAQSVATAKQFIFVLSIFFASILPKEVNAQAPDLFLTELANEGEFTLDSEVGSTPPCGTYLIEFALIVGPDSSSGLSPEIDITVPSNSWVFDIGFTDITVSEEDLSSGNTRFSIQAERTDQQAQFGDGEILEITIETGILIALEDFPDKRGTIDASQNGIRVWKHDEFLYVRAEGKIHHVQVLTMDGIAFSTWKAPNAESLAIIPIAWAKSGQIVIVEVDFGDGRIIYKKILL